MDYRFTGTLALWEWSHRWNFFWYLACTEPWQPGYVCLIKRILPGLYRQTKFLFFFSILHKESNRDCSTVYRLVLSKPERTPMGPDFVYVEISVHPRNQHTCTRSTVVCTHRWIAIQHRIVGGALKAIPYTCRGVWVRLSAPFSLYLLIVRANRITRSLSFPRSSPSNIYIYTIVGYTTRLDFTVRVLWLYLLRRASTEPGNVFPGSDCDVSSR